MAMKYLAFVILLFFESGITITQTNVNISNWPLFDGEQYLAVNPANPNNLICAWMQLKINLKIGMAVRSSADGGTTWTNTYIVPNIIPQFTMADPTIAFSRTGIAYLCYIEYGGEGADTGVVAVIKSTNNGVNWTNPVIIRGAKETSDLAIDRPWITIDNSTGPRDGYLYVTSMPPAWATFPQALHLKYSSNGGTSWSNDIQVSTTSYPGFHGSMGIMDVSQDGALNIVYTSLQGLNPAFAFARTTNLGQTFTRNYPSPFYPLNDTIYQASYTLTSAQLNPQNLNLVFIGKINNDPDVYRVRSNNSGINWSSPLRINNDPINNGIGQDMSWSFQTNGMLGAAWRDRRNGVPGSLSPFDVYFAISTDGGITFGNNIKVTNQTSPFNNNGVKGNDFLGFVLAGNKAHLTWADFRNGGINWEIYYNNTVITGIKKISTEVPVKFSLYQNYPNPFNPVTKIKFSLPNPSEGGAQVVKLIVYDILGNQVASLIPPLWGGQEGLNPGTYEVDFDGGNYTTGLYIYRLETESFIESKKMILIK